MPAPQFHLTFGELVAHHPLVRADVRDAVVAEPQYTHLGSIFHDLPYYGNMLAEMIRYGLRRPAIDAPWAYRMHCIRPDRFAASFVRAARLTPGLEEREGLALVAGLFSHCALDLTLHPLVNYCARRDTHLYGGHETFHHRITEKYHALFFHVERFGDDVMGTPDFRLKTHVVKQGHPRRPTAEPQIIAFMREAYRHAYGNAPAPARWTTWVRNFRHFGLATGNQLVLRNSRKTRKNGLLYRRYFKCADFDFNDFYVHSERRVAELVNLAADYFTAGDFSAEAEDRFCALARIDNLAEPSSDGLPALPALPDIQLAPIEPAPARRPKLVPGKKRAAHEERAA
jgi:hypothetical protein